MVRRRVEELNVVAPTFRRKLPCRIPNYCIREGCLDRQYVVLKDEGCLVNTCTVEDCTKRREKYPNNEMPVSFCMKQKCPFLERSRESMAYRCAKFMAELRGQRRRRAPSGHTTLRLKWKKGGWTYREV